MANYKIISSGPLNLRAEANTNSAILAKIPAGTIVQENYVLQKSSEFIGVFYGKLTGYVSAQYVTSTYLAPTDTSTTTTKTKKAKTSTTISTKTSISNNSNNNNNQNNQNMALTLSENAKKYIKIGLVALGVGAAGFAVYKMSQKGNKQAIAPKQAQTALSGTSRKRKKTKKQSSKKIIKLT